MTYDPRTDAQLLAEWAGSALSLERYELAAALTRLALQASRIQATTPAPVPGPDRAENPAQLSLGDRLRLVPMAGTTRAEEPARSPLVDQPTQVFDRVNLDSDVERLFMRDAPESARCEAKVVRDGVADVCHGVVWWDEESGWRHIDTRHDVHVPVVPMAALSEYHPTRPGNGR